MLKYIIYVVGLSTGNRAVFIGLVLQILPVLACAELPVSRQSELVHLIQHDCGSCHGMKLTGGLGPPLTAARLVSRSPDELFHIISYGVSGAAMPPWNAVLSAEEIEWMVTRLQSGIPVLNPE